MLICQNTHYSNHSAGLVSVQHPLNIDYFSAFLKQNSINCCMRDFELEKFNEGECESFIKAVSR